MPPISKQEQTDENTIRSTKKWFIGTHSGEKIVQMDPYKFLCISESRRDVYKLSAHWAFDLPDLKDRQGVDFAFISKEQDAKLHLAVWAHQSALAVAGRLETMFRIPKAIDRGEHSAGRHKPFYHQVPYNSLVTHCILLRYLYTGDLTNQVDLRSFHITYAGLVGQEHLREPTKAFLAKLLLEPMRTARWEDIWPLAARYEMHDLVEKCVKLQRENDLFVRMLCRPIK
ncbi:hypothetical protein BGZ59_000692 [Podila verticillata]|nr:hypothetical protein BGZ59_000692 [Podila verticillata]KFH72934.1 hypothetical protein MVEG_00159 [Podila verticillata NRRL 6337]